jgi:hypothetical protein
MSYSRALTAAEACIKIKLEDKWGGHIMMQRETIWQTIVNGREVNERGSGSSTEKPQCIGPGQRIVKALIRPDVR